MNEVDVRRIAEEVIHNLTAHKVDAAIMELARKTIYQLPAGELLDKFIVCHARIWNLEEVITSNESDKEVAMASKQLRKVNAERARLREEINRRFDGIEVGTEKSYHTRMDLFDHEESNQEAEK